MFRCVGLNAGSSLVLGALPVSPNNKVPRKLRFKDPQYGPSKLRAVLRALGIDSKGHGLGPETYRVPRRQIKEDLKTIGGKEDPEACWTTPFAQVIRAE